MNDNQNKTSLTDKILNKLKSGDFKMKSKIYFILKAALVILGIFIVAILVLFLISFISFSLRTNGALISSLLWVLMLFAGFLLVILELLFQHFAFSYKKPVIYSLIAIIAIIILCALVVDRTSLHHELFNRAREGRLPVFGPMYRNFGPRETTPFPKRPFTPRYPNLR